MIHIIIDNREQTPWNFGDLAEVSGGTLKSGDYALAGDDNFAVERKSLQDYTSTVMSGWKRFSKELKRMDSFPVKVIIIEADWRDLLTGKYNSGVQPAAIIARTTEMILDGVVVLFCSNPFAAAGLCWRILVERQKRLKEELAENTIDISSKRQKRINEK
ncbi:MAG: ERCC4 domain-containing protein [Lentisphaeria bacterium]